MGMPKYVHVNKKQDFYPCILGLHILKLVKKGYYKFEIEDRGDEVIIKAIRRREEI